MMIIDDNCDWLFLLDYNRKAPTMMEILTIMFTVATIILCAIFCVALVWGAIHLLTEFVDWTER